MPTPYVHTALDKHPEVARKVGLIVAEYALLERLMWTIYALLPNIEPKESVVTFFQLVSIRRRKALVLDAAEQVLSEPYYKALKHLWKRFHAAAKRRTEVAHCQYMADDETVVRLQLTDKQVQFVPLDERVFERTFTQYHILGRDLQSFQALIVVNLDRLNSVMSALPRSPLLKTPIAPPEPQGLLKQDAADVHSTLLARLKIPPGEGPYRKPMGALERLLRAVRKFFRFWRRTHST
jgi:hypothetical protein